MKFFHIQWLSVCRKMEPNRFVQADAVKRSMFPIVYSARRSTQYVMLLLTNGRIEHVPRK